MQTFREQSLYVQLACELPTFFRTTQPRVGIHGLFGSFSDEALHRFTSEELKIDANRYDCLELIHSQNVLHALQKNEIDLGLVAFANSGSGGYVSTIAAMGAHNFRLAGMFVMPIRMCMLAHPGIRSISEITVFRGHPTAVSQCRRTLQKNWPNVPRRPDDDDMDTALSAKMLATGELPRTAAVFGSRRAAEQYGVQVLAADVHDDPNNATCFALLAPAI